MMSVKVQKLCHYRDKPWLDTEKQVRVKYSVLSLGRSSLRTESNKKHNSLNSL